MDYDDTDFRSQNFQLAGEDNNKFPSSFRPFDIDDQLHGHFRFDNLIESELFFGVQGHDNNWIEGLSAGGTVVDFSSSAAESCSISRTNNVWSEATSTESVEMLLKAVRENEMTCNMDGNARHQLNGMDSQIDSPCLQDKSSNSPTGSVVAPNKSHDQSCCTLSGVTEDPPRSQPQVENIAPISMDKKAEQVLPSNLSDGKSNSIVESSASNNTSKSCLAVGDYFDVVHDDSSLDNLNVKTLAEVDSRKSNSQSFSELVQLQNIYATDSYHLEPGNKQDYGVDVTPEFADVHDINEHSVEDDIPESKSLSCTSQRLDTTKLLGEASNETLLSKSSDGLLEAITNPVKVVQKNDDTCGQSGVIHQLSFAQVEDATEGLKGSVDRSNEHITKEFDIGEEGKYGDYCQPESDSRNPNPHLVSPSSTKNSNLIQSPKQKQLAYVTEALEETKNTGMNNANLGLDYNSKAAVTEQHQDSVDLLTVGEIVERANEKESIAGSRDIPLKNSELNTKSGDDDNAKGSTDAPKDKIDSSGGVVAEDSSAAILDEKDLNSSSINHEGSIKGGATSALEDEPGNHYFVSPTSKPQEKTSAASVNSNSSSIPSIVTDAVAEKTECKRQVTSSDSLSTRETQNKLEDRSVAYPQKCPSDTPLQSMHHEDLSSAALAIPSDKAIQKATESRFGAKDDLNTHLPDNALNQGAAHTPSPFSSKSSAKSILLGSKSGDGNFTEATYGSPTVISCSKPSQQEGGEGSNALLDHTVPARSNDPKDPATSDDAVQSSNKCSSTNVEPTIQSSEATTVAGDDGSFSFEAGAPPNLSEKAHSPDWKPFPSSEASHSTEATTEDPQRKSSLESPLQNTNEDSKSTSIVGTGKGLLLERQAAESQGGLSVSLPSGDISKAKSAPSEEMQQHPTPESSRTQISFIQAVQKSTVPDLNTSVSSAALVHQPFTDLQHVQLRAQIFVYGALIQGIPPAEAYMVSAFGEPVGGGQPAWEAVWRAAVDRFQNQKSPLASLETPTTSRIGSSAAEQGSKDAAAKAAPAGRTGGKFVPSTHSAVPLHSPTVDMSSLGSSTSNLQRGTRLDFGQVVSPLFTYHSSQMRQPTSAVASWFPQSPGPRPANWLIPPQTLIFDSSKQLPAVPTTEATKAAPSKNVCISNSVSPGGVFLPSQGPSTVCPPLPALHDEKQKAPDSTPKRGATSQKPRKRKKASTSPEQQHVATVHQLNTDHASDTLGTEHPSVFTLSSHSPCNVLGSGIVPRTAQVVSMSNYKTVGSKDSEQRVIFSEQICSAVEQSKGQAYGAATHAMEALKRSEGVWSQLSANLTNILPLEVKEKLTSAAAAATTAASVAKAAAEAARMAAEAAVQAKMTLDEALTSTNSINFLQKHGSVELDVHSKPASVASLTPISTRKIKDKTPAPNSIISAAREATRKRVEEASATAKRAENMDAILKAAELAAEAVSQAGTTIAMGDPLPFSLRELLEAGPNGYWKSDRVRNKKPVSTNDIQIVESLEVGVRDDFNKSGKESDKETKYHQAMQNTQSSSSGKYLLQSEGVHSGNGVEDVPTTAPLNGTRNDTAPRGLIWNGIKKGSLVEVVADVSSFGRAWFSAKVIDINENSVCISYSDNNGGIGHRQEWVSLEYEGDRAPRIRLAHPITTTKFEGTRKRRRDTGNYSWAIGDHVDAWIKDSWREGVISQNYQGDERKLLVQFPAGGDPLVVDVWNLRPSLVWKDGQWTDWSCIRERKAKSNKSDSPYEKRQRTDLFQAGIYPVSVGGEAGGPSTNKNIDNPTELEEPKPLALSDRDMIFNVGKDVIENKANTVGLKRSGLQKEGSGVVIGVPRPGRKKKFMEVSKHYVVDQVDKVAEGNASARFAKYLMPQAPRPRESASRIDQKGRKIGEMRPRGLKPTKSQNIAASNAARKDPLSMTIPSSVASENIFALAAMTSEHRTLQKNSAPNADLRTEDTSISEAHIEAAPGVATSRKNLPTGDRAKRRFVSSVDSLRRNASKTSEIRGKESSDSSEPRRSNRRIQPTSRLLEGLQSSLIISKVPGEKGARTHHRSASSRGRPRA